VFVGLGTITTAQTSFNVNAGNYDDFVESLYQLYGDEIQLPRQQVLGLFQAWFDQLTRSEGCLPPEPTIIKQDATSISFDWDPISTNKYHIGYLNLSGGSSMAQNISADHFTFANLELGLHMFFFLSYCSDYSLSANIVIVDKDVLFDSDGNDLCDCTGEPLNNQYFDLSFFEAFRFTVPTSGSSRVLNVEFSGTINGTPFTIRLLIRINLSTTPYTASIYPHCLGYGLPGGVHPSEVFNFALFGSGTFYVIAADDEVDINASSIEITDCGLNTNGKIAMPPLTHTQAINGLHLSLAPNPVQQEASITYHLPQAGPTTITLLDINGRVLKTLLDTPNHEAGTYQLITQRQDWPTGLYYLRIVHQSDQLHQAFLIQE